MERIDRLRGIFYEDLIHRLKDFFPLSTFRPVDVRSRCFTFSQGRGPDRQLEQALILKANYI